MNFYKGHNWTLKYEVQKEGVKQQGKALVSVPPDGSGLWIYDAAWTPPGGQPVQVLRRGMIPFLLVPYNDVKKFKDGVPPSASIYAPIPWKFYCGTPTAPLYATAQQATDACVVEIEHPMSEDQVDHIAIACKFQVSNYQYIHRWTFFANGVIEVSCGVGATMYPDVPWSPHAHCAYVRLDFQFAADKQAIDELHVVPSSKKKIVYAWRLLGTAQTRNVQLSRATRWRIRNAGNDSMTSPSFVIEPGTIGGPMLESTADLFVVPNSNPDWNIGSNFKTCLDLGLLKEFQFAPGATDTDGNNIETKSGPGVEGKPLGANALLWVVMRELHRPRYPSEDTMNVAYHEMTLRIAPMNVAKGLTHFAAWEK